jgi:hypothetical protein
VVVVTGYTLTIVAVGKAPLGTETVLVEEPDVAVTVRGVADATVPETGVPYEVVASPEGGGALVVAGGFVPPPEDATAAVTVSVAEVTVL